MSERERTPTLRRSLGVWRVSLTGIGVILGAGIHALVGPAAARAGAALWLSFVLAGVGWPLRVPRDFLFALATWGTR